MTIGAKASMGRLQNGDAVFSLLLIIIGAFVIYGSLELGIWDGRTLRAGFLPMVSGAALVGLSLACLAESLGSRARRSRDIRFAKPALVLAILLIAIVALPMVGASSSIFLMMMAIFIFIERIAFLQSAMVAGMVATALHLIFTVWLGVPVPVGPFGF